MLTVAASLAAADVPEALLAGARHVHASSWFLLQDRLGPGLGALFSAARSAGVTTSLDTNWDPSGRWASPDLSAAIAQAGLLLPNQAEAIRLAGADDLDAAVSALVAAGPRVVVKLGERGALCADGPTRYRISLPPVRPVDATGAGDCFDGAFAARIIAGDDPFAAARYANVAAALATTGYGAVAPLPRAADVARLLSA